MHGKQENRFSMLNGLRRLRREDRGSFLQFRGEVVEGMRIISLITNQESYLISSHQM